VKHGVFAQEITSLISSKCTFVENYFLLTYCDKVMNNR